MSHEIPAVEDDREALKFALGCLRGASLRAAGFYLALPFRGLRMVFKRNSLSEGDAATMAWHNVLKQPRFLGVACALAATGLGLAYLGAAGAPMRYLMINAAALGLGLAFFAALAISGPARLPAWVTLALGALLLATAWFGIRVDGAARWVAVGPVMLQVSLLVLPAMLVGFAQRQGGVAAAGMALAAIALAMQPDRAMAAALAAGLAALALACRDRWMLAMALLAAAAFGTTLIRSDTLPAVPYVDQVFYSAFDVHVAAGMAVLGGACLLLVPALWGLRHDGGRPAPYVAFGAIWLAILAAAALGNYPTPVLGFGGSAIVGYLLSLSFLPRAASARSALECGVDDREQEAEDESRLCLAAG